MKVYYRELNDDSIFTVDMRDVLVVSNGEIPEKVDETVCDCTKFRYLYNKLDVKDITVWNLLFNKKVKDALDFLKNPTK